MERKRRRQSDKQTTATCDRRPDERAAGRIHRQVNNNYTALKLLYNQYGEYITGIIRNTRAVVRMGGGLKWSRPFRKSFKNPFCGRFENFEKRRLIISNTLP